MNPTEPKIAEEWQVSIEKRHLNTGRFLAEQIITSERNAALDEVAKEMANALSKCEWHLAASQLISSDALETNKQIAGRILYEEVLPALANYHAAIKEEGK